MTNYYEFIYKIVNCVSGIISRQNVSHFFCQASNNVWFFTLHLLETTINYINYNICSDFVDVCTNFSKYLCQRMSFIRIAIAA